MTDTEAHVLSGAYEEKADAYFESPRADYVSFLPANPDARVIELGSGSGATGRLALAEGKTGYYVGMGRLTPSSVRKMVEDAGFEVVGLEPLSASSRLARSPMSVLSGFASLTPFQINLHGRYCPKA